MKKTALYLILLTFIICLSACDDIESQEVPTLVSSEEVLTNDETPEPVAEQKWVLIKETTTYPNSDESVHYIYEYDAAGNMTRKLNSNLEYLYKYDNNGLLIGETVTYSNGDKYPTDYMYDSNGNMIKKIERDYQGNDLYIYEYEYDSDGKLIIEKDFEGCTTEYEYDISGKLKKSVYYFGVGENDCIRETEYDSYENIVHELQYIPGNSDWDVETFYENEYDEFGNLISTKQKNTSEELLSTTIYEYKCMVIAAETTEKIPKITPAGNTITEYKLT